MNEAKYSMNQVIYFIHRNLVVKGVIDEIILHYTQKNVIIKYIVRPYGYAEFVTIDEDKIYTNIEEAKSHVIEKLKQTFTKGNIIANYEKAKEDMKKSYQMKLDAFDDNFRDIINSINKIDDEYCDGLEAEYQEQIKENNDGKEQNS